MRKVFFIKLPVQNTVAVPEYHSMISLIIGVDILTEWGELIAVSV